MATYRPESLTDGDINKLKYADAQDRYIDPKSKVIVTLNRAGPSFGLMLYKDGKQKWHTLGRFRFGHYGLAQARRDATARLAEADRAETLEAPSDDKTLRDAFAKLEARHLRLKRQPRTIEEYRYLLDKYSPDWWDKKLTKIRRGAIKEKHDLLSDASGPTTAKNWVRAISPALSEAVEYEWIENNPAKDIKLGATTSAPIEVTDADIMALRDSIDTVTNPWRQAAWWVALLTGMRRGDIQTMRWEHVDLDAATLRLPNPKGGESRATTIPLSSQVVEKLRAVPRLGGRYAEWVFPSPRAEDGHIDNIRVTGLPNPHYARHCWSTAAERAGVDEWRRAILLNQKPRGGVNVRYTHSRPLDYRAEAQAVSTYILSLRAE